MRHHSRRPEADPVPNSPVYLSRPVRPDRSRWISSGTRVTTSHSSLRRLNSAVTQCARVIGNAMNSIGVSVRALIGPGVLLTETLQIVKSGSAFYSAVLGHIPSRCSLIISGRHMRLRKAGYLGPTKTSDVGQ